MYCVYNRARTELVFAARAIGVALDAEGNRFVPFLLTILYKKYENEESTIQRFAGRCR